MEAAERVSIGIFAHNEESGILTMLETLAAQDFWSGREGEVLVLENGSNDRTAEVASAWIESRKIPGWELRVVSLAQGGKARTWNRFVHHLRHPDTSVFAFLDADIELGTPTLVSALLEHLRVHEECLVVTDTPLKSLAKDANPGLRGRLSLDAAELAASGPAKLCGQCYAARRRPIEEYCLPEGILVEDGFLKALVLTAGFREAEDRKRLAQLPLVHYFEAETRFTSLYRHEKRILLGTLVNRALFLHLEDLRRNGNDPLDWLWERHRTNPSWLADFSRVQLARERFFRQSREFLLLPLRNWRARHQFRLLPGAILRTIFNFLVAIGAARSLRRNDFSW